MAATCCFEAVKEGNLAQLQAIVEEENRAGNDVVNAVNEEGSSLLHVATLHRHLAIVKWILSDESGGFKMILAKDNRKRTALHMAVENQDLEACKEIAFAAKSENWERDDLLSARDSNGFSVLHLAALHGATCIITWILLDEGGRRVGFCNVLGKDKTGKGVLQIAMEQNHLESCVALLEGSKVDNGERASLVNSMDRNRWTILHTAAASNIAASAVAWILSDEGGRGGGFSDVLGKNDCGETALHLATERGDLETCQAIVDRCKVENGERAELLNAVDRYHRTVLHLAVIRQHLPIVEWLLSDDGGRSAGFNQVLAKSAVQSTAFDEAMKTGSVDICKALAKGSKIENRERLDLLNSVDKEGRTALHIAAEKGDIPLISWLLSDEKDGGRTLGFDSVLRKANDGKTAMHYAAMQGNLEAFQTLVYHTKVENGERVELLNAVDGNLMTALQCAAFRKQVSIISWLLSPVGRGIGFKNVTNRANNNGVSVLHYAAESGCLQEVVANLENGEREELINATDKSGWNILHTATHYCCSNMTSWLLSKDGGRAVGFKSENISALTKYDSYSPLHLAAGKSSVESIRTLLSSCTPVERMNLFLRVDKNGATAIHAAVREGCSRSLEELLRHPESQLIVDARDNEGMTALHRTILQDETRGFFFLALRVTKEEIVKILLGFRELDSNKQQLQNDEESSESVLVVADPNASVHRP